MILDFLALSEDNILELKAEKGVNKIKKKGKALIKTLKIKFLLFFILSFFILLLFWYYLICFCVVYKNTQYHLIKDSLIGFVTGLLTPFGTKIIAVIFRYYGLKCKHKYLYTISNILQIFI